MRVVAGEYKGRKLVTVPSKSTRPTSDKVKESLFNRLGPYFDGGTVLDLFAGSGGLGIEALSRGANQAIFVDKDHQAIQKVKENIKALGLEASTEVYRNDAFRAIKALHKRGIVFDYIFLDPPYYKGYYQKLLLEIDKYEITNQETLLVLEHDTSEALPERLAGFIKTRSERYGGTIAISFYRRGDV